jgi:microsomal epoxide hydrolase
MKHDANSSMHKERRSLGSGPDPDSLSAWLLPRVRKLVSAIVHLKAATMEAHAGARATHACPIGVEVPQSTLDRILARVREYDWYQGPVDEFGEGLGWNYGMDIRYLHSLAAHWLTNYDWRRTEDRINQFRNYQVEIDGLKLHYLLEKGSASVPRPLLIIHGWPYSFVSYLGVVKALAHPEQHGGTAESGFDVVLVSVPGFGLSQAPPRPMGLRSLGRLYNRLMVDVLGYEQYFLDGGDQGALSASYMAVDSAHRVIGLHQSNAFPRHPEAPYASGNTGPNPTAAEKEFVVDEVERFTRESAYFRLHVTRPETLAPAMMESPVGLAAWISEKYYFWTDRRHRTFEEIISFDQLLDEVMLYLVTRTFRTSLWTYAAFQSEPSMLPGGQKIATPTGIAAWPDPLNRMPPREFVERSRSNIIQWTDMPRGGHFPFYEEPALYVADLLEFGRKLR